MQRKSKSIFHSFSKSLRCIIKLFIFFSILYLVINLKKNGLKIFSLDSIYKKIIYLGSGAITFFGVYEAVIKFKNNHYFQIKPDSPETLAFVDRQSELKILIEQLINHKNINVYGQSGIGKSYLAKQLTAILNHSKNVTKEYLDLIPKMDVLAFYFSVASTNPIEESIVEAIDSISNSNIKTITDVLKLFEKNGTENVCFIFDGATRDPSKKTEIELLIKKMNINKISFLIVSEEPIRPVQIKTEEFNIGEKTFTDIEIKELITKFYPSLKSIDPTSILTISSGLPVLVDLMLKNNHSNQENSTDKNSYLLSILEELWYKKEQYYLFRTLIVLCIYDNSANIQNLSYDKQDLASLSEKHLVKYNFAKNTVSIHKLIEFEFHKIFSHRDNVEYQQLHYKRFSHFKKTDKKKALAHLLCTNSELINKHQHFIIDLYEKLFVRDSYDDLYNYFNLFELLENKSNIDRQLATYITYGNLYNLMGIGKYLEANNFFNNLSIEYGTLQATGNLTDMDFRFLFKKADLSHLICDYNVALEDLELILISLKKSDFSKKVKQSYELDCQLLIAHIHAHMGVSIDEVIEEYSILLEKLEKLENLHSNRKEVIGTIYIKTLYGLICSYLVKHDHRETIKYEYYFQKINDIICQDSSELKHLQYRVNRHLSMYLRQVKDNEKSKEVLQESIRYFEDRSHRIIYDFYFSLADILREEQEFETAIKYYSMAEKYAHNTSDKNLYIYCRLGIILSELHTKINNKEQYINELKRLLIESQEAKLNIHSLHIQLVLYALCNQQESQDLLLKKMMHTGLSFELNLIEEDWSIRNLNNLQFIVR